MHVDAELPFEANPLAIELNQCLDFGIPNYC